LLAIIGLSAVAYAVLGDPSATMAINGGASATTTTTVSIDSNVTDAAEMSFSPVFKQVDAGSVFACGIATDGSLWTWGTVNGQIDSRPVRVGSASDWKTLSVGGSIAAAIKNDGTLWTWTPTTMPVKVNTWTWNSVSVGSGHILAIRSDTVLYAWGYNYQGQLGIGNTTNQTNPYPLSSGWAKVSAGYWHSVGVTTTGQTYSWGDNTYGQLADGTKTRRLSPTAPVFYGSSCSTPVAGDGFTIISYTTGEWRSAGRGNFGQLGAGWSADTPYYTTLMGSTWRDIKAEGSQGIGIKNDGSLWTWGQDGSGAISYSPARIGTRNDWTGIAVGERTGFAVSGTSIYSWGEGTYGCLGDGTLVNRAYSSTLGTLEYWQPYASTRAARLPKLDGTHTVTVRYRDVGMTSEVALSDSIILDCTSPAGMLTVNSGWDVTNTTTARLHVWVPLNDATEMSIQGGPWIPFAVDATTTLSPGDGLKTVTVKVRDLALNEATFTDTVFLDTTPPTGTMALNAGATVTRKRATVANSSVTGAGSLCVDADMWRRVDGGYSHMLALDSAGDLWGWGANSTGAIGDGTFLGDSWALNSGDRAQLTKVVSPVKWRSFDAAYTYSLGISTDGELYGWGANTYGMLANGTTVNVSLPIKALGSGGWRSVSGATAHALGLKEDGTLWAWGDNTNGQLGLGTTTPSLVPVQVGTDADWASICAGAGSSYGIKTDGSLWSWGAGTSGVLGLGDTTRRLSPTQVGTETVWASVSAGGGQALGVKTDGTLWAWGGNNYGVLGVGDTTQRLAPTRVGTDTDWVSANGTLYSNSLAVKSDGSVWTWGENYNAQAMRAYTGNATVPGRANDIAAGWDHVTYGAGCLVGVTREGRMMGAGYSGRLTGKPGTAYSPVPGLIGWISYALRAPVYLADTAANQNVTVRYSDSVGNELVLTDGIRYDAATPLSMTLDGGATNAPDNYLSVSAIVPGAVNQRIGRRWQSLSAGAGYSLIHFADGPVEFAGIGDDGQRGDGSLVFRTSGFGIGGGGRVWARHSGGYDHSLAIAPDGSLWSWGSYASGQLGLGNELAPSPICVDAQNDYRFVWAGIKTSFAIRADGTLWAWGANTYGQLGDGTTIQRTAPVQVGSDTDWATVSNWGNNTLALKADGSLWSWGLNTSGELGHGDSTQRLVPTQVQPGTTWRAITAGSAFSLAIRSDDSLWAWGANGSGQLGDGTTTNRTSPVRIGLYSWRTISAGQNSTLGIRSDGSLWAWGDNSCGQLGDGSMNTRTTMVRIGTATDWQDVRTGGASVWPVGDHFHTIATTTDGRVFTWGGNAWGAIGDGSLNNKRYTPVEIGLSPLTTFGTSMTLIPWASGQSTIHACYIEADGNPVWLSDSIYIKPPAPSISALRPVFGSVAETTAPEISATVLVNGGALPAQVEVRVDGAVVPSFYDSTISNSVSAVVGGLSDDTTHTATVKVTDAAGSIATASTSFLLEKGPRMPHWDAAADCRTCHGATVPHTNSVCYSPTTDDEQRCLVCHMSVHGTRVEQPYPRYYSCNCHYYSTAGTPNWTHRLNPATCKTCHTMFRQGQDPVPPETIRHTTEVPTCTPCHRHEVRFEHARRKTDAGVAYGCNTCHTSAVTRVQTAISANNTQCSACHDPIDHVAPHTGTVAANCQACHSGNLDEEHVTRHGLDCEVCHSSTDPAVFAAIRDHNRACTACHTGDHPHSPAAITDVLANGEKACTACHSTDLVAEHAKPTSAKTGSTCDVCHLPGGPRAQISGTWDRTCDTPACHADGSARAVHENWCLACHATTQPGFASSKTSFAVGEPVNRETACAKCHAPGMVGTHPYHQPGSNCGAACHADWGGDSLLSATPRYTDPSSGASFATATSKSQSPAQLHAIHAQRRWPANLVFAKSACSSCHAVASCAACHTGAVPATHETHSAAGGTGLSAYTPWTGEMANGVSGADQRQRTATTEPNQCASASCHNVAASATRTTRSVEDYNYVVGQNTYDPAGTNTAISTTGTWRYRASNRYTGGRMSYASTAATLSASVDGSRFEILSEKDPYRGIAEVYIDGVLEGEFDAYAAVSTNQTSVFSHPLSAGTHSVSVRWTGRGNPAARAKYVVVDAFRVQGALPESIAPTCSSCHSNRVANHW